MKSSSTNGLRWILALALLAGGARARAQSAPRFLAQSASDSAPNSSSNSHAFRAGIEPTKNLANRSSNDSRSPTQAHSPSHAASRAVKTRRTARPHRHRRSHRRRKRQSSRSNLPPTSPSRPASRSNAIKSPTAFARSTKPAHIPTSPPPGSAAEGGVRIDFVVREQLFFNQVIIRGVVAPPSDASAAAAMSLSLGAAISQRSGRRRRNAPHRRASRRRSLPGRSATSKLSRITTRMRWT